MLSKNPVAEHHAPTGSGKKKRGAGTRGRRGGGGGGGGGGKKKKKGETPLQTRGAPGERARLREQRRVRRIRYVLMQKETEGKRYTFASVRLVQGRDWYTGESSDGRQMGTQRSLALVCSLYAVRVACEESTTKSVMLSQSGAAAPLTSLVLGNGRCARNREKE